MPIPSLVFALFGLIVALLAVPLVLRRVPPNALYGLRVPATFRDDTVWYDANAAAGRDLIVFGAVTIAAAFIVPVLTHDPWVFQVAWIVTAAGGSIVVAILGWRRANRMFRERHQPS